MTWKVIFNEQFNEWFDAQTRELQKSILSVLFVLESEGVSLGRPYVDTLKSSRMTNLKELRVQHQGNPYRLLFAFDPERQAIVLVGGNKAGNKRWYQKNIKIAEQRFDVHLKRLEELKKK